MDHIKGDVGDIFPMSLWIEAASRDENVEMRVVVARPSKGLENHNGADVELDAGAGFKNIPKTGMACSHQGR